MLRRYFPLLGIITLLVSLNSLHAQSQVSLGAIKKSLTCTCACAMTVDACEGSMECDAASKLAAEASRMIDAGLEQKVILASFTSRYGEKILAEPTKQGFNLLAWIVPFAVTLIAGIGITQILRRWTGVVSNSQSAKRKSVASDGVESEYASRLDKILSELE